MKIPQGESQRKLEQLKKKISDEAERKRRETALDDAIENTFPASDPVSAEQPVKALGRETPPSAVVFDRSAAEQIARSGSRRFGDVRVTSAYPSTATAEQTLQIGSSVPTCDNALNV